MQWVQFNVSDQCTLKCQGCHWFSQNIKVVESVRKNDILYFLTKWRPKIVQFSGGEPTLWPDLSKTINEISSKFRVIVSSNGMKPNVLADINRRIKLDLSIHQGVDCKLFKQSIEIARQKKFKLNLNSFDYFNNSFDIKVNQVNQMDISQCRFKVGQKVSCRPAKIYFGSDGRAYQCEKGLRTKDNKYYAGFTLRSGIPCRKFVYCVVDKSCLTAGDEQEMRWF